MPKRNPKYDREAGSRYYKRVRSVQRGSDIKKDRAPLYFGLLFIGIVAGIIVIVAVINNQDLLSGRPTVRLGDTVVIDYIGRYQNQTIFDSGTLNDIVVGDNNLLTRFDQELVGIELNTRKDFVVPAHQGYLDPSHHLFGEDLYFEVRITQIERWGQVYKFAAPSLFPLAFA